MSVYNNQETLARAIKSIQDQTFKNWKLIIVLDGPTDRSEFIAREFERLDQRIRVIVSPKNQGLASCLNLAWKAADTELIARMDADDMALPQRLELQSEFMKVHPEIDILGAAVYIQEPGLTQPKLCVKPATHEELVAKLYRDTPFFHPVVMMRRTFLEAVGGYDQAMRYAQDTDLWLRAYLKFRFHNLPTPLLIYHPPATIKIAKLYWGFRAIFVNALRNGVLFKKGRYAFLFLIGAVWKTLERQLKS